jgi:hypothetical protein
MTIALRMITSTRSAHRATVARLPSRARGTGRRVAAVSCPGSRKLAESLPDIRRRHDRRVLAECMAEDVI